MVSTFAEMDKGPNRLCDSGGRENEVGWGLLEGAIFESQAGFPEGVDTRLPCVPEHACCSWMDVGYEVSATLSRVSRSPANLFGSKPFDERHRAATTRANPTA